MGDEDGGENDRREKTTEEKKREIYEDNINQMFIARSLRNAWG